MKFKELKIGQKFLLPDSYYKWTKIQELGFNAQDYTGNIVRKFLPDDEVIKVRHISGRRAYDEQQFGMDTMRQYPLCRGNTSLTLQERKPTPTLLKRAIQETLNRDSDLAFFEGLEFVEE